MDARRLIEAAFADTPRPDPPLVEPTYDDEGVSDYFAGRTWRGNRVVDLRFHEAALVFFTPDAFRYYLPAFLLASLDDREEADVIPDHVVDHFSHHARPSWAKRVESFSPAECDAIIAFLWEVADEHPPGKILRAVDGLERRKRRG